MATGFENALVPNFCDPNFRDSHYDGERRETHRETTEKNLEVEQKVATKASPFLQHHNQPGNLVGAVPALAKPASNPARLMKHPSLVSHGLLRALPPKNAALQPIRNPVDKPAPLRNASTCEHPAVPPVLATRTRKQRPQTSSLESAEVHRRTKRGLFRGSDKPDAAKCFVEAARAGEFFTRSLRAYPTESNKSKLRGFRREPPKDGSQKAVASQSGSLEKDDHTPSEPRQKSPAVLSPGLYYYLNPRSNCGCFTPLKANRPKDEPEIRYGRPNPYRYGPIWLREIHSLTQSEREEKIKKWSEEDPERVYLLSTANYMEMHRLTGEGISVRFVLEMMNEAKYATWSYVEGY